MELEGDGKHVKKLEEERDMINCNPVSTPYVKPTTTSNRGVGEEAEDHMMGSKESAEFRRTAAPINYVALDRPDLSFVSRVAASTMSNR